MKKEPEDKKPTNKKDEEITVEKAVKDDARLSDSGTDSEMEDVETDTQVNFGFNKFVVIFEMLDIITT